MTYAADVVPAWDHARRLIKDHGYERRDEPFMLASGQASHDYIDGKFAVDHGERLEVVCVAMIQHAQGEDITFTHVGGLTMGADPLAISIALVAKCGWFSVRKERKPRGREQWIEGARLGESDRVLLVDDVVTSGGSIMQAYDRVVGTGATVAGVMPMVDRGETARPLFSRLGIRYAPLVTYKDLGIDPVG